MSSQAVAVPTGGRFLPVAFGVIGSAAFGLLIGGLLVALLAVRLFGYQVATVQSSSMEPALRRGDVIVSKPVDIADVASGQVVLFMAGEQTRILVAHRAVGFINMTVNIHDSKTGVDSQEQHRLLQTKGDANSTQDSQPVSAADLRGRLWFTIPQIGFVLNSVPLQTVLLGVAGGTGLLWIAYELSRARSRRGASRLD